MQSEAGTGVKDTNRSENGASVVICCYNSASRIIDTLDHLLRQKPVPGASVEIILVDNNSTDRTAEIASAHWEKSGSPFSFRTVKESRQGLSYARQCGIAESKFETIVFCDDDNWLDSSFVKTAFGLFQKHPDAVVLGGPIEGVYEKECPDWLRSQEAFLAIGTFPKEGDITDERAFVPGAGLVLRKSAYLALEKKGFQFFCSDRKGSKLSSGGDTELCYALVLAGGRVYYSSELKTKHFVPAGRMHWNYFCKLLAAIGAATVILNIYKRAIRKEANGKSVLRKLVFSSGKYVLNPFQVRHYRKTKGENNRDQIRFEVSRETFRQALSLLIRPGYFSRIKKQIERISK